MAYSTKLSDAIHILSYIEIFPEEDLSSQAISRSIETNPVVVRRLMSALKQAGLLSAKQGVSKPKLEKASENITLLEIAQAVEPEKQWLHINHKTNPNCMVGSAIQGTLNKYYDEVQLAAEKKLAEITLAQVIQDIHKKNEE